MAKLRHIAINCDDPEATARFYVEAMEMREISRIGLVGDGPGVIYLSDGTMNLAIIKMTDPSFPNFHPKGLNHIGFVVDDLDRAVARATECGARTERTSHQIREGEHWEHKMTAPDGVAFDLYDVGGRGWPGISGLEDLGVAGEITADAHAGGRALSDGG